MEGEIEKNEGEDEDEEEEEALLQTVMRALFASHNLRNDCAKKLLNFRRSLLDHSRVLGGSRYEGRTNLDDLLVEGEVPT
jgi:hypothetical protein